MIFYFSGTGNSKYVADEISSQIGTEIFDIAKIDKDILATCYEKLESTTSIGFVFPIYSWGVPPIVLNFIKNLEDKFVERIIERNIPVWGVCTCGDETGNAPEMLRIAMRKRKMGVKGIWSIIMPNTYVLLPGFDVDSDEVRIKKINDCKERIKHISEKIIRGEWEEDVTFGSIPVLKTKIVFPLFKKWGIFPKKWRSNDDCIHCGKCAASCPVSNIDFVDGRPKWNKNCVSCLACYHVCPVHAVEYGNVTLKKGQYLPSLRPGILDKN